MKEIRFYTIQEFRKTHPNNLNEPIMQELFTIEEIRIYILSHDSLGDVLYNLCADKVIRANAEEETIEEED